MLKKSLFLATAIILGTFCTTQAANNAVAKFVKTEISCPSGTTCAVRIALPTNKRWSHRGPHYDPEVVH